MENKSAFMIRHTHWDREWYLTFEQFRTKLVRLIDNLLDSIDADPNYPTFMLDGQSVAIEDYLEIRPGNFQRLKDAVKKGKIVVGPWYVLPDEMLISGEAHIRNYIYGDKVCKPLGHKNNLAYLPDSFGHPAQMPQITTGLGMDTMLFWRGVAGSVDKTEFYWESCSQKSKSLCIHMCNGYGNSARLSAKMNETIPRLDSMISELSSLSTSDVVLLMNGSDHVMGQSDAFDIVNEYNTHTTMPYHIDITTLQEYVDAFVSNHSELKTYKGEFCSGDRALILAGTISTRNYLKKSHNEVEKTMERYLEPIAAYESLVRGKYEFKGYRDYLWRCILKNSPHDSICGCSVDEVHRAMVSRYEEIEQAQGAQLQNICAVLCDDAENNEEVKILVFEPTQDMLPTYIEIEVDFDPVLIRRVNFANSSIEEFEDLIEHPEPLQGATAFDENGRELSCMIIGQHKDYFMHLQDITLPETYKVNRTKILVSTMGMDFGFHTIAVRKADQKPEIEQNRSGLIENYYYEVRFANDSFTVLDKKIGKQHEGVCRLIDVGDAGDEYTYSWPSHDSSFGLDATYITSQTNFEGMVTTLTVKGTITLPVELTEDRSNRSQNTVVCPVSITAKLYKGIDRIDFDLEIENLAKDHRLQVEFPAGCFTDKSSSYSAYAIVERDIELPIPGKYDEFPCNQHVMQGYASISDNNYGITGMAKGIYEYEAKNRDEQSFLRFTLLRCVGWLSRPDLLSRNGNGGWMLSTPDAQCLGKHQFAFSICYHEGNIQTAEAYKAADRFLHDAFTFPMFMKEFGHENKFEFISHIPSCVRVCAVKQAEERDGIIVRLVNLSDSDVIFDMAAPFKTAYYTNLFENRVSQIHHNGIYNIEIGSNEIRTIELVSEDQQ